jgi:hypothetical protein
MLFLCTIYTHDYTPTGGDKGGVATEPAFDSPLAKLVVDGSSLREAAAGAYIRAVGRKRARWMREQPWSREEVASQETSQRAIAASLRKTNRRIGECYELDHLVRSWLIKVEPAPINLPTPRRLRLPTSTLRHLCRTPFPN